METSKLYEAITANDAETVESLLAEPDEDTDPGQRDSEGRGFLHLAVLTGADPPVFQALTQRLDLAVRDKDGNTALDLALAGGLPDAQVMQEVLEGKVKDLLLEPGEEGEAEAKRLLLAGWCHWPVTAEEASDKSEEAAELLDKLMELQDKVAEVHKAVLEGRLEDLQGLLDNTLLAGAVDRTGLPLLHKAVLFQHDELVEWLISEFADMLDTKDNMGRTALHYAAAMADEGKLYNILKEAGADETVTDLVGITPTDYQQQPDALPIADILKKVQAALGVPISTAPSRPETPPLVPEPLKPVEVIPISMYVPNPYRPRVPPPATVDGRYIAQHMGTALTLALTEIAEKRPWDPIEYLSQWLYKYHKNLDEIAQQEQLLKDIRLEEKQANKNEVIKFKRRAEEKRIKEEEKKRRKEEEEARKKREKEELQRQAREAILAQRPKLPTVTEEEVEDTMVRERDENGQTELHILAAQSGADLVALVNLGYSLADRDANNKTPRDIAEEQGLTENVEAIDNYVSNLLEQEKLETLTQLILDGYDKLDAVLEKVSTEGLPETVTDFVNSIPEQKARVDNIFKAVSSGVAREVENALERKSLAMAKDKYGRSPLHLAILAGHYIIAQNIVENVHLSVKSRDNLNRTPLHYAAALSEEMTDFLTANGADADAIDAKQHTPTYYKDENEEILALKLKVTAELEAGDAGAVEIRTGDDNQPEEEKEKGLATVTTTEDEPPTSD